MPKNVLRARDTLRTHTYTYTHTRCAFLKAVEIQIYERIKRGTVEKVGKNEKRGFTRGIVRELSTCCHASLAVLARPPPPRKIFYGEMEDLCHRRNRVNGDPRRR